MNCIIIEDQLPAQRILKKYIADSGSLHLVGAYTDAIAALQVLKSEKVDLMFLDIHLPKMSGIEFLKTISNPPQVILTTAFQDYALESYELNVVDYLLKPFSFQRFVKAISKVGVESDKAESNEPKNVGNGTKNTDAAIYIKNGYDFLRIETGGIVYIKIDLDYTELYLKGKKHISSESLRYWEGVLSDKKFMRIHKSYIINTTKIIKISGNQIYLENDFIVPIGRAYKNDFMERFMN